MEVIPGTIKQETVDNYDGTKPDVNKTNILDSMKIKLEPTKLEPQSYVLESKNLDQKFNLTEEAEMIGKNDKCMLNYS